MLESERVTQNDLDLFLSAKSSFVLVGDPDSPQFGKVGRVDHINDYSGLVVTTSDGTCRQYPPLIAGSVLTPALLSDVEPLAIELRQVKSFGLPDPDNGPDDFELPPNASERKQATEHYRAAVSYELEIVPALYESQRLKFLQARALLLEELAQAHAPYTGREVACALETRDQVIQFVRGHNEEHGTDDFDHAEPRALRKFACQFGNEKIKRVFMIGYGQSREKKICPCFDCFPQLLPYVADDTELVLFSPKDFKRAVVLSPGEYLEAYAPKPYYAIQSTTKEGVIAEIRQLTPLNHKDTAFLTDLRFAGIQGNVEFYLTGSASGRGWVSNVLHKALGTMYRDIDIVAVSTLRHQEVESIFEGVLAAHFGDYTKETTMHTIWRLGITRNGLKYTGEDGAVVEVQIAPDLQQGMSRLEYLERNMYIQIS